MELVTAMMINTCQQEGGRGEASGQHRGVRFLHSARNDRGGGAALVSLGRGKTPHAVEPSCRGRHSERSEESRCMELVTAMMVNTCRQEGGRGEASGQHRGVRFLHSGRNDREAVWRWCHWGGERRQTPGTMEPSCRDRHSERSEESRCMELVTAMIVNTCRQEGGRGKLVSSIGEGDFSTSVEMTVRRDSVSILLQ